LQTAATSEADGPGPAAAPPAIAMLAGCTLARVAVDDSLSLSLRAAGRAVTLRVDAAACLRSGGREHAIDTDGDPASAAPLLGLLNRRVESASIRPDGGLELAFSGGAALGVDPSDHAISWSATAADGAQASCLAEGKVVWA